MLSNNDDDDDDIMMMIIKTPRAVVVTGGIGPFSGDRSTQRQHRKSIRLWHLEKRFKSVKLPQLYTVSHKKNVVVISVE